jgi:hypothetical protein
MTGNEGGGICGAPSLPELELQDANKKIANAVARVNMAR